MSLSKPIIKNLRLVKSNEQLYVLVWEIDHDIYAEFEIECKHINENEDEWRNYGKTMLTCFPIWRHRLTNGLLYEFRVIAKQGYNLCEICYCKCDIRLIEGNGNEFTIKALNDNIIRQVFLKSLRYNREQITHNNNEYMDLKPYNPLFADNDYKLWIPFNCYQNPFYKKRNYLQWHIDHNLLIKDTENYKSFVGVMCDLFVALVYPKFNKASYDISVDLMGLVFLCDDYTEHNEAINGNVGKSRLFWSKFCSDIFDIPPQMDDGLTQEMDAFIVAHRNIKQRIKQITNSADVSEFFEYLHETYSYYISECHSRTKTNLDENMDYLIPDVYRYLVDRFYCSSTRFLFHFCPLFMSYDIPYRVKSDENFIKAEVAAVMEVCIVNDIFGLPRDRKFGVYNMVILLEKYGMMSMGEAIQKSCLIHDSFVDQFLEAKKCIIETYVNEPFYKNVNHYIDDLELWMAGDRDWYKHTKRYNNALLIH